MVFRSNEHELVINFNSKTYKAFFFKLKLFERFPKSHLSLQVEINDRPDWKFDNLKIKTSTFSILFYFFN